MPGNGYGGETVAQAGSGLGLAHARLVHDPAFQFSFQPPPALPPLPAWLRWVGELIGRIAPYLGWALWAILAVGVVLIATLVGREILARRGARAKVRSSAAPPPSEWAPDVKRARLLLEDADQLAEAGQFMEAARLLLHRSIEDIEERRPNLIAVGYTSRDIAALDKLPASARQAFEQIAQTVERGLFGGRALDAAAFAQCRSAYAVFALREAWARR